MVNSRDQKLGGNTNPEDSLFPHASSTLGSPLTSFDGGEVSEDESETSEDASSLSPSISFNDSLSDSDIFEIHNTVLSAPSRHATCSRNSGARPLASVSLEQHTPALLRELLSAFVATALTEASLLEASPILNSLLQHMDEGLSTDELALRIANMALIHLHEYLLSTAINAAEEGNAKNAVSGLLKEAKLVERHCTIVAPDPRHPPGPNLPRDVPSKGHVTRSPPHDSQSTMQDSTEVIFSNHWDDTRRDPIALSKISFETTQRWRASWSPWLPPIDHKENGTNSFMLMPTVIRSDRMETNARDSSAMFPRSSHSDSTGHLRQGIGRPWVRWVFALCAIVTAMFMAFGYYHYAVESPIPFILMCNKDTPLFDWLNNSLGYTRQFLQI